MFVLFKADAILGYEKDVEPVGGDYIEPQKSDDGKVISFFCKLCDCRFNDVNAKEMHLKGRRHRLQFKVTLFKIYSIDFSFFF